MKPGPAAEAGAGSGIRPSAWQLPGKKSGIGHPDTSGDGAFDVDAAFVLLERDAA
jgi:hypothetical protein